MNRIAADLVEAGGTSLARGIPATDVAQSSLHNAGRKCHDDCMTDAGVREVTDSRVLAAMSHPLRRRLMDVLKVYGPATVSALAGQTGQAVANISHHLRVLGAAGLILEAPELARDRREHWWRLAAPALRWAAGAFDDDPARQAVASAAVSLSLDRQVSLARAWYAVEGGAPRVERGGFLRRQVAAPDSC